MDVSEFDQIEITRRRGIYLLPNLFTTSGLFAGFYSIVAATKGDYEASVIALFLAMIMDALDGRIARLTNTQSSFGAEYDSLSDMVCFGVVPAFIVYSWGLQYLGKVGWICSFLFVAATGLRLARFNIQLQQPMDKRFFLGLPCPAAAGAIAGMVWLGTDFAIPAKTISEIVAVLTVIIALLQVSNIKYYSFKEVDFRANVPFVAVLIVALLYAIVAWDPPKTLCTAFFLYVSSGPFMWLQRHTILRKRLKNLAPNEAKEDGVVDITAAAKNNTNT